MTLDLQAQIPNGATPVNDDYPATSDHVPSPAFPTKYLVVRDGSIQACRVFDPNTSMVIPATSVIKRDGPTSEAYWVRKQLRESIGGAVFYAVVVKAATEMPEAFRSEMQMHGSEWAITDQRVVVKQFDLPGLKGNQWEMMNNEVRALRYIEARHQVVPFKNISIPVDILTSKLMHLWIILPFYNDGDLFDFAMASGQPLDEKSARNVVRQVFAGLRELRRAGICHRDIAPENMMIHQNRIIMIDFGTAKLVPYNESTGNRLLISQETVHFGRWVNLPPEMSSLHPFDGFSLDLWAAMVTLFRLVTGELPWDRAHATDNAFELVHRGHLDLLLKHKRIYMNPDLADLFQQFFKGDPKHRLGMNQVLQHSWLNGA